MRFLLILLFIPFLSFSQTYSDLMRVDSKEQFVRTMIENGYERISNDGNQLVYALNPTYDDDEEASSSAFANYLQLDNGRAAVFLQFHLKNIIGGTLDDTVYDKIFKSTKFRCDYDSLVENIYDDSDEMVQYKCNWNEDERRIAFSKKDGTGYVYYIHF